MRDRPILRAFADARGLRSHAGTSGMMKVIIARAPWDFVSP
jgi:alkylation response protein AidB-like acyl-CoA dehydrogenase